MTSKRDRLIEDDFGTARSFFVGPFCFLEKSVALVVKKPLNILFRIAVGRKINVGHDVGSMTRPEGPEFLEACRVRAEQSIVQGAERCADRQQPLNDEEGRHLYGEASLSRSDRIPRGTASEK